MESLKGRKPREVSVAFKEAAARRLLGKQAVELDFFERAFRAVNLAIPGRDASGASGSTASSTRSTPKAASASSQDASSDE